MHRRDLLMGAGAIAAAAAVWKSLRSSDILATATAAPTMTSAAPLLDVVCDLVIPDTSTPGAKSAGVPAFIVLALRHHLAGTGPDDLVELQAILDQSAGAGFMGLTMNKQREVLAQIDAAEGASAAPVWLRIKKLILMGYYTSEIGASRELQYQLVPGRFDPDLPVKPGDRAWSSDWIGQGF